MNLGRDNANHPCVVWGACFLWLISVFEIIWSVVLFFTVGDIMYLAGADLVNAFVLLSGITMLPTNMEMLYLIGYNRRIESNTSVACCPVWLCLMWSVIINLAGIVLCFQRIAFCKKLTETFIQTSMNLYRVAPRHKQFIDNMQWYMKCCGLKSYRDWFLQDWYDKVRDYEWDPYENTRVSPRRTKQTDSVPLSCCKSGTCISNYLSELGTYSINTNGCATVVYRLILTSMIVHIIVLSVVILVQLSVIKFILCQPDRNEMSLSNDEYNSTDSFDVKHIMDAKENFMSSSTNNVEDDEEEDTEPDDTV